MKARYQLLYVLLILFLIQGCSPVRHIPDGNYLLVKNQVRSDTSILEKEQFLSLIKQKPNRKFLGFYRFYLQIYNLGAGGDSSRFKNWLKRIGEEPVVLDSSLTDRSLEQMNLFIRQQGFFRGNATDSVIIYGKKRAGVIYKVKYGEPYRYRHIEYSTQDTNINKHMKFLETTSLLHPGDRYNEDVLEQERERISRELKDRGYYYFSKNFITFTADSSVGNHQADIFLYINRINENIDPSLIGNNPVRNHQSYHLRNILIQADYDPRNPEESAPSDTVFYKGYYFLSRGEQQALRYDAIVNVLFIKSGDTYLQRDLDYTYDRLQGLNVFRFINMVFTEVPRNSGRDPWLLDVKIQLTPNDRQDFTVESELTNTGGNKGIAGSFGYSNRNIFRGAEVLDFRIKAAVEAIPNFNDSIENKKLFFFNTYEIGPELTLKFKKFLKPGFMLRNTSRYFNPTSIMTLGYDYQNRPDYTRSVLNFSFGYNWEGSKTQRWIWYPFVINSVNVRPAPSFTAKLDSLHDPRLSYSYQTHLILSQRLTWIFNNQQDNSQKNFFYVRGNLELSGVVMSLLAPAIRLQKDNDGNYLVSGIKFSQYVKPDIDISYHDIIDKNNTMVYRIAAGVGFPFGNSKALPFEKSFFGGGANSLRAWSARTLGPGSYRNTIFIEQSGDIKLEGNLEYRSFLFTVFGSSRLEGAAFIDMGNIWTRNNDPNRPGAQFNVRNLFSETAVGSGLGLRFDFGFFILRLDGAVKLHDPSLDPRKRWVYPNQKFVISDITTNLAIGYPF
ncbi:MAG: BamA/TamA family outer membrane protein [Bacteroidia bacterium]|nr:BamA/TamA family outer membrane protein [Bacteroidia bacterium]